MFRFRFWFCLAGCPQEDVPLVVFPWALAAAGDVVWIPVCLGAARRRLWCCPPFFLGCWEGLRKKAFLSLSWPSSGASRLPVHVRERAVSCEPDFPVPEPCCGRAVVLLGAAPARRFPVQPRHQDKPVVRRFPATRGRTAVVSPAAEQALLGVCREGAPWCRAGGGRQWLQGLGLRNPLPPQCHLSGLWACVPLSPSSIQMMPPVARAVW